MNESATFKLVFAGELVAGFSLEDVKHNVARLYKLDAARVEKLFRSRRISMKRDLAQRDIDRYVKVLREAGMVTRVEPEPARTAPGPQTSRATAALATPPAAGAPAHTSVQPSVAGGAEDLAYTAERKTVPAALEPFAFTGKAWEYFKIWIVNILLSVLTVGVYSAWAKVRNNRYFYGNMHVAGASFEYLASPIAILKGRAIAVGFFAVYYVVSQLEPIVGIVFLVLFLLGLPWLIVKSLTFRNRYTAYRNLRFGFHASYLDAMKAYVLLPILAIFTLGLLFPYVYYRQNRLLVDGSSYGRTRFAFAARPGAYYRISLVSLAILIAGAALGSALAALVHPWLGLLALPLYLYALAYYMAHIGNLMFNATNLGAQGFESRMDPSSLAGILVSNWLAVIFSLGLAIPWARVRMARYRAARLALAVSGDLERFVAEEQKQMSALGEELGEVFDIEIGL